MGLQENGNCGLGGMWIKSVCFEMGMGIYILRIECGYGNEWDAHYFNVVIKCGALFGLQLILDGL